MDPLNLFFGAQAAVGCTFRESDGASEFGNGLLMITGENLDVDVALAHGRNEIDGTVPCVVVNKGHQRNAHLVFDQQAGTVSFRLRCFKRLLQLFLNREPHAIGLVGSKKRHLGRSVLPNHTSIDVSQFFDRCSHHALCLAVLDDGQGVGVVRASLEPHHDLHRRLFPAAFSEDNRSNLWLARRERSRFVKQNVIDVCHALQRVTATNDRPALCGIGKGGSVRNRCGEQEGTRARYDPQQQNDFPIFREGKVPDGKGSEEHQGDPYGGEFLNATVESRRYFPERVNRIDEAREACVVAHGKDFADNRPLRQHQPRLNNVANADVNRDRFPGERGFVERTGPLDDSAVGWNEFAAANFDVVAGMNEVNGDDGFLVVMHRCKYGFIIGCDGEADGCAADGTDALEGKFRRFVHLTGRSWQAIKAALHRFARFEQGIAFQVDGERYENGDDQGFLPHAENAGPDHGQAREHLEAHLETAERAERLLEHLDATDRHAGNGNEGDERTVVPEQFGHHHDDQHRQSNPATDEAPLVGANPIGGGLGILGRPTQDRFQSLTPGVQEALLVGDHKLQENTVIVGNFDVQHTGLASNNTVKPLNWHAVSLSDRRGLHADEFVMLHVGRMTEGTQHR